MIDVQFEYDQRKNIANQSKHHVSFEEAKTVFYDEYARLIHDPDHSFNEERYLLFGMSLKGKYLVVSFSERVETIRIISARLMTREELYAYEQ